MDNFISERQKQKVRITVLLIVSLKYVGLLWMVKMIIFSGTDDYNMLRIRRCNLFL